MHPLVAFNEFPTPAGHAHSVPGPEPIAHLSPKNLAQAGNWLDLNIKQRHNNP